ncbi:MAG: MFS transporter [Actinobacteria bacterium]|jgi:AAHS family cis,cis-muconate transporter-like MFS transporter|nr:MFS transporter [Actinomycetota bacterium]MCL5444611.1 MFS transporter [Actinomycetota bacterium]
MEESEESADPEPSFSPSTKLFSWRDPSVVAVAVVALFAGFGQFGAVAALGSVAQGFGHVSHGATITDRIGLSGTVLGVGLSILRLASLGALPLSGLADRFGRRPVLIATCGLGLALTVTAAFSPSYWWFVAIFALGRPFLSATTGVAQVTAAEHTASAQRAKAVSLIAAGYGVGAGLTAIIHGFAQNSLGFRGVFALAVFPLAMLPFLRKWLREPARFENVVGSEHAPPVLGPVGRPFRRRLILVSILAFAVSVITGPANSFIFLYAQEVRHLPGLAVSAMVVAAGVTGLSGLLLGRWMADRWGRRITVVVGMVGLAVFGSVAYSGSDIGTVLGYVLGVLAGATFAPAGGAFINELFPTSVRASVAGWQIAAGVIGAVVGLVAFGEVADIGNHFSIAALLVFLPMIPVVLCVWLLPETRNREPEELWD